MYRRQRIISDDQKLNLKNIHEAIASIVVPSTIKEAIAEKNDSTTFEDALQAIETCTRPAHVDDVKVLVQKLISIVITAQEDAQKWKLLLLVILRKRYHMKSPEAQSIKKEIREQQKEDQDEVFSVSTSGHGERMSFYILFICLHYLSGVTTAENNENIPTFVSEFSAKACFCLGRLAISAGGTRDICALVEHLVYEYLVKNDSIKIHSDEGKKRAISAAVIEFMSAQNNEESSNSPSTVLNEFVRAAAKLLDNDFTLIKSFIENEPKKDDTTIELQSTMNTFIPHHNRGNNERRLAQSMAELMIWSATQHSKKDSKFVQATANICASTLSISASDSSADDKIVASLHIIQTSIRRFRKQLNESSRKQGFSLGSSYSMEPSSITLSMVKRGREGDVVSLQRLAKKRADTRIMTLISNRNADPSKAIPMQSVRSHSNWISLEEATKSDDELIALQLKIQEATVRATVQLLRKKFKSPSSQKEIVLASLDGKIENDYAAVLVASALDPNCNWDDDENLESQNHTVTLFIGDQKCTITTPADVLSLLNQICNKHRSADAATTPTTTKDVQNFIERHLGSNNSLFLFTSTDIKIEQRVLTNLQVDGNTIHCHVIDDFAYRMEREKAKVGDITITLTWDNECDLDLHCICPNGDRISYSRREGGGSLGGGYLDVDMNVQGESKEPIENIFFGDAEQGIEAAQGQYKVIIQNYSYHGHTVKKGEPVPWRLRLTKNGEIHNYTGECKGSGSSSDVTAVEFHYSGRKAPLPEAIGSALTSSNLVSITSSTGHTIDSLSGLLSVIEDHETLENVQELVRTEAETEQDGIPMEESEDEAPLTSTNNQVRPLMVDKKSFYITNRDRLYLNLSKLPKLFHLEVNQCFKGSVTLMESTASELAKRLISDKVPVEELKKAGYHDEIVNIVKDKMYSFGI
jgi:hypothetical protein